MSSLLLKSCSRDGKKRKPIVLCTPLESRWPLRMIVRALLLCLYVNAKRESGAPNFLFADFEGSVSTFGCCTSDFTFYIMRLFQILPFGFQRERGLGFGMWIWGNFKCWDPWWVRKSSSEKNQFLGVGECKAEALIRGIERARIDTPIFETVQECTRGSPALLITSTPHLVQLGPSGGEVWV